MTAVWGNQFQRGFLIAPVQNLLRPKLVHHTIKDQQVRYEISRGRNRKGIGYEQGEVEDLQTW